VLADLASLAQARELADRVRGSHDAIALLVNNAGVGAGRPPYRERQLRADGHELRLAVNYLAPALLARRLIPALENKAPARMVNISFDGMNDARAHRGRSLQPEATERVHPRFRGSV
jgi:NAD(P)-dependent dehydrogenase (short-subunit alcohol dehydrogenase family)